MIKKKKIRSKLLTVRLQKEVIVMWKISSIRNIKGLWKAILGHPQQSYRSEELVCEGLDHSHRAAKDIE